MGSASDAIKELIDIIDAGSIPKYGAPEGAINIIFDGPPSHESGRFVEVEDDDGNAISAGEWIDRGDGYWALRIAGRVEPSERVPL